MPSSNAGDEDKDDIEEFLRLFLQFGVEMDKLSSTLPPSVLSHCKAEVLRYEVRRSASVFLISPHWLAVEGTTAAFFRATS